jgi:hypothetical protein
MLTKAKRQQVISDIVKESLPAVVDSVDIVEGFDSDGDAILRITVVLKKGARLGNIKSALSLARNIRAQTPADVPFPLIDFMSAADAATRRKREAA